VPQTPEAIVLHYCDQLSAAVENCAAAIKNKVAGENWTDRIYLMDAPRQLYVPPQEED
jgi:hypothetical protein